MIIRGFEMDVDFEEELEPYMDQLNRAKQRGNKIQACSPFRAEHSPSFAVNLDNGLWIDSGSIDEEWHKGNFIKLLAFLQGVTVDEAERYLFDKYRTILHNVDEIELKVDLKQDVKKEPLSEERLQPLRFRHPYLSRRGISEKVQRAFDIGYDKSSKSVSFAWRDKDGNLINIKFRRVANKVFWYLSDGLPIKEHIYGLHLIYKMGLREAVVTESETDALYLWTHGIPAIALGSANLSKRQEELLKNSPLQTLTLALDNDKAGQRCNDYIVRRLSGLKQLNKFPTPKQYKDVNDIPAEEVVGLYNKRQPADTFFLRQYTI